MIIKLQIAEELINNYVSLNHENSLIHLNRVNIFIGSNNTGKSRFIRSLFATKNLKGEFSNFNVNKIAEILLSISNEIKIKLDQYGIVDISSNDIGGLLMTINILVGKLSEPKFEDLPKLLEEIKVILISLKSFEAGSASYTRNIHSTSASLIRPTRDIQTVFTKFETELNSFIPELFSVPDSRLYIPILRGLRPTQFIENEKFNETYDNYLKRTIKDYFQDKDIAEDSVFTGLRLYEDTKRMLLGSSDKRLKIKEFENFLSKNFFNGQLVTIIPNIEDDSLHVSIGDEERPIYELGDGIQSIIILLYPLFFSQHKTMLVFIEEPENSMHPGLQRLFMETILQPEFINFQFFITTHSNHFLDFTIDNKNISIYSFNRILKKAVDRHSTYQIENVSYSDSNVLDLIGVRNSSVFLSNCTIWVEGITDRIYIKKFLEIYQQSLKAKVNQSPYLEDFNYSFVEYAGNNITHWTFGDESKDAEILSNRISKKIFLIADLDSTDMRPKSAKSERLKKLKKQLGKNFKVIGGREIENLILPQILIDTISKMEGSNAEKLVFDEKRINRFGFLKAPIGTYISDNFKNLKRKYKAESGTIACKLDFCRIATSVMTSLDDLSPEALKLVSGIYKFIQESNPK